MCIHKPKGGFKLWEGGVDLAAYLANIHGLKSDDLFGSKEAGDNPLKVCVQLQSIIVFCIAEAYLVPTASKHTHSFAPYTNPHTRQPLRVLELGCGHGLPGLLCLLAGAEVHFQDYNGEVCLCVVFGACYSLAPCYQACGL